MVTTVRAREQRAPWYWWGIHAYAIIITMTCLFLYASVWGLKRENANLSNRVMDMDATREAPIVLAHVTGEGDGWLSVGIHERCSNGETALCEIFRDRAGCICGSYAVGKPVFIVHADGGRTEDGGVTQP
jgi:hypothetical protein